MPPMDRRPPLAVPPRRLLPHRNLRPARSDQTPPASIKAKPMTPVRSSLPCDQLLLRPEFRLISSQLTEMAERAKDEFGENYDPNAASIGFKTTPSFERGRFYEVYSARRSERLKRKQGEEIEVHDTVAQDPSIAVESAKRRNSKKKVESLRKSVPANFSASRASSLRSSVRSSKEIKKAGGCAALESCEKKISAADADAGRRTGTRSLRRI